MARQRVVISLSFLLVILALSVKGTTCWGLHEKVQNFFVHLRGSGVAHTSEAVIPEPAQLGPQLLGSLWRTTDSDLVTSRAVAGSGRVLQSVPGEGMAQGSSDPDPDPQPNPARRALRNDDFVYVAPCTPSRLPLAQASRYWRKGMRAVFVLDQPEDKLPADVVTGAARFRESFAWFPNFRRMANGKRDHYLEGDRRAAMTPVLAYAALADPGSMTPWTAKPPASAAAPQNPATVTQPATSQDVNPGTEPKKRSLAAQGPDGAAGSNGGDPFQWMLAGDDDTIFFMRGVKALLRDYDPQLPYFITDSMYVGSQSPQPGVWSMRCYPCHVQWGRWRRAGRRLMADGADSGNKGCGCSTAELCKRHFSGNETRCQTEWEGPVPFGGVGFIFSIGFFKHLAAAQGGKGLRAYETCINAPETSVMSFPEGGDAFMSRCFWRLGFPITDPGYTPLGRYMGEILHLHQLYQAPANLTRGELPQEALTRWSTAVSMHLGARQQKSFRAAAMTIKYISGVYDLVAELLWPGSHRS